MPVTENRNDSSYHKFLSGVTATGDYLELNMTRGIAGDFTVIFDGGTTINARLFLSGDGVNFTIAKDAAGADVELIAEQMYRIANVSAAHAKLTINVITGTWNIALIAR